MIKDQSPFIWTKVINIKKPEHQWFISHLSFLSTIQFHDIKFNKFFCFFISFCEKWQQLGQWFYILLIFYLFFERKSGIRLEEEQNNERINFLFWETTTTTPSPEIFFFIHFQWRQVIFLYAKRAQKNCFLYYYLFQFKERKITNNKLHVRFIRFEPILIIIIVGIYLFNFFFYARLLNCYGRWKKHRKRSSSKKYRTLCLQKIKCVCF